MEDLELFSDTLQVLLHPLNLHLQWFRLGLQSAVVSTSKLFTEGGQELGLLAVN